MTRRRSATWEQNLPLRLHFEQGAAAAFPGLTNRAVGKRKTARIAYTCTVPVEGYEARRIEIRFRRTTSEPEAPTIYADGPESSLHRYSPIGKDPGPGFVSGIPTTLPSGAGRQTMAFYR